MITNLSYSQFAFLYSNEDYYYEFHLIHWGRVAHICVGKLTIIGSDNGLSPGRRQAIIWTNAEILSIRSLETKFSEILIEIHEISFKQMHVNMSSAKRRPFRLGLNRGTRRPKDCAFILINGSLLYRHERCHQIILSPVPNYYFWKRKYNSMPHWMHKHDKTKKYCYRLDDYRFRPQRLT